jgi:hypothetical protein
LGKSEQKKKRAKISSRKSEQKKKRSPLIPHCVNLEKYQCSSSQRKMRRREKRRKEEVEASFKSYECEKSNNIVNINIAVAELKNTDFRWSKRDGTLWPVHIRKKIEIRTNKKNVKFHDYKLIKGTNCTSL